jgi:hypothetical protein
MSYHCGSSVHAGKSVCFQSNPPYSPCHSLEGDAAGAAENRAALSKSTTPSLSLSEDEIALAVTRGRFEWHIGFVFCDSDRKFKFLHLAGHKKILVDTCPVSNCALVGKLPFSKQSRRYLRYALQRIASARPSIPFGPWIAREKGTFSRDGDYIPPVDQFEGLTCATFVLEVCRGVGFKLLVESDWQVRLFEDTKWKEDICNMLADQRASKEHIERVREGFSGLRIRPEDVAATVTLWPNHKRALPFSAVDAERKAVVDYAEKCCPYVGRSPL